MLEERGAGSQRAYFRNSLLSYFLSPGQERRLSRPLSPVCGCAWQALDATFLPGSEAEADSHSR
jgi:hypothetical protein